MGKSPSSLTSLRALPLGIALLSLGLLAAPWAEAADPTYEQLAPLLEAKCTLCHDNEDQGGGLDLSSYDAILRGGASGDVVKPGNASGSKLYRVVARLEQPFMPRGDGPLSPAELKLLEAWIQTGLRRDAKSKPLKSAARPGQTLKLPTFKGKAPLPLALPLDALPAEHRADAAIALDSSPGAPFLALGARDQILTYAFPAETKAWSKEPFLGALPFPGRVHDLRFSRRGGHLLALGGEAARQGRANLYDVRSGRILLSYTASKDVFLSGDLREDLAQIALGGPDRRVRLVSCRGEPEQVLEGHTDWVTAISYSPDGVLLATADRAGGVFVWESRSAQRYLRLPAHPARVSALAWRPDSNLLVTACEDGWIRAYEAYEGKEVAKIRAHGPGVLDVSFARDGNLISAGRDRRLKLWGLKGNLLAQSGPLGDLPLQARFRSDPSLVVSGDWQGDLRLWQIKPRPAPKKGKKGKGKGKGKGKKKPKGKPLPLLIVPRGRVHAAPPPLEERLANTRRAAIAAVPSAAQVQVQIWRATAQGQRARLRARRALARHRLTLGQALPPKALGAQRRLVLTLRAALEAARRATPQASEEPRAGLEGPGRGALRAGSAKAPSASPIPLLARLLSEAEAELGRRQRAYVAQARPALAKARQERKVLRELARRELAAARRTQRLLRSPGLSRFRQAFGALAFWKAEERYVKAWRRAKASRRATTRAEAEAARLAPALSVIQTQPGVHAQRVLAGKAAMAKAAAELRSARLMSREAASLADELLRVSLRISRVGELSGKGRPQEAQAFLVMARESLLAAREARAQRRRARRALRERTWVQAGLRARRSLGEDLSRACAALAARLRGQKLAQESAGRAKALEEFASRRAAARRAFARLK